MASKFDEAEVLAAMRNPEAKVEIGGLFFTSRTPLAGAGIVNHGPGLSGHPVLRNIIEGATKADWYQARVSHWLNKPANPDRLQIMFLDFPWGGLAQAVEFATSVTFSRRECGGLDWVVASNGRASALDVDGEKIDIYPLADGWRWTRPCAALRAFSAEIDDYVDGHAPTLEEAMTAAAAARDVLLGEVTKLAARLGLKVAA